MTFPPTPRVPPAPLPSEALDLWLEAVACRMPARLGDLALGPSNKNSSSGLATPTGSTTALPDEQPARTAYASGVAAAVWSGTLTGYLTAAEAPR